MEVYLIKNNSEIKNFGVKSDTKLPLHPRDAFFGGRTNSIKLNY